MRAAPAVEAALNVGGAERLVIALLHAVTGAALAVWVLGHLEYGNTRVVVLAVLLGALVAGLFGAGLARKVLPRERSCLRWDGQAWLLLVPAKAGGRAAVHGTMPASLPLAMHEVPLNAVGISLDLGTWVLLRLQAAAGGYRWCMASANSAGQTWHGLRVALRAHAGAARSNRQEAKPAEPVA